MPEPMRFKGLPPKKPSGPPKSKAGLRNPVFGVADHDNDSSDDDSNALSSLNSKPKSGKISFGSSAQPPKPKLVAFNGAPREISLAARHTFNKNAAAAQEVDPSVYDYDGVYDSLHIKPKKAGTDPLSKPSDPSSVPAPKYMTSLLAAAEVRKRDQLRAKEKALARERAAEGDEFAGKEAFVTGAYRTQQAEMAEIEKEEKQREEEEMAKRRKEGGAMTGLYRDLLGREEERHEAAMKATEEAAAARKKDGKESSEVDVGKSKDEQEEEIDEKDLAKQRGATVNEDGQVVDKRQLLSAGLNVSRKQLDLRKAAMATQGRDSGKDGGWYGGKSNHRETGGNSRQSTRERQSRMLEQQLEDATKRAADEAEIEQQALERMSKRRITEKDVSSARERYLARKREAEAAKKASDN